VLGLALPGRWTAARACIPAARAHPHAAGKHDVIVDQTAHSLLETWTGL
jgi:hypothetical protein